MSDTSTPSNHDNRNRHDCSCPSGAKRESSAVALRPDSDTLRFIRSFARCYTVVSALPTPISAFIAN